MRIERTDHVHVVLNPAAGSGMGRRVRVELEAALTARGLDYRIEETRARGEAVDLAAAAASAGAPVVASVGGDGTAHEVVNGLLAAAHRPRLALIPVGTGNDFVKMLGGGGRRAAYDALAAGTSRPVDIGIASWEGGHEAFLNSAGTGIDVEVVRHMERMRALPGGPGYLLALVRALFSWRAVPLSITVDGEVLPLERIMMAAVSNGRCVGGSFRLSPDALIDDGSLDLCRIDALGIADSLRLTMRVRQGTHTDHPAVTTRRGHVFALRNEDAAPLWVQLDGELRRAVGGQVTIETRPAALHVMARGSVRDESRPDATAERVRNGMGLRGRVVAWLCAFVFAFTGSAAAQELPPDSVLAEAQSMISPRTAMIRSWLFPGWGQASVGAYGRGAFFFTAQGTSAYMLLRSLSRLSSARGIARAAENRATDSLNVLIENDTIGDDAERLSDPFAFADAVSEHPAVEETRSLVRARTRQRQDWITYTLFFTLLSGVDAFVATHLRDAPVDIEGVPTPDGAFSLRVSVPVGRIR